MILAAGLKVESGLVALARGRNVLHIDAML